MRPLAPSCHNLLPLPLPLLLASWHKPPALPPPSLPLPSAPPWPSYAQAVEVSDTEVVCTAKSSAQLDGLLTVFHQERSAEGLSNLQARAPGPATA